MSGVRLTHPIKYLVTGCKLGARAVSGFTSPRSFTPPKLEKAVCQKQEPRATSDLYSVKLCKVCSFWSWAFLDLCSGEHMCAQESTFFIFLRKSKFWATNSFLQRLIFPPMYFTKSLMRWRRMHMTKMNKLYLMVWFCCCSCCAIKYLKLFRARGGGRASLVN